MLAAASTIYGWRLTICLRHEQDNPSVSVNLDSSPFNTPLRFVAAVDRALPARTIHREGFFVSI